MNKKYIIGAVSLVAILFVGVSVVSASVGGFWDALAKYAGLTLGNNLSEQVDGEEMSFIGAAGDTYQDSQVYSQIITNGATTSASIACDGWLIKGVDYYVVPSTTLSASAATTSITIGIYANTTTTTVETSLATDTYSTSTAVYQTYVQADGAGQTCASGKYIQAQYGSVVTTSHTGVLNVEYLKYE